MTAKPFPKLSVESPSSYYLQTKNASRKLSFTLWVMQSRETFEEDMEEIFKERGIVRLIFEFGIPEF